MIHILAWSSRSGSDLIYLYNYLESHPTLQTRISGVVTNNKTSKLVDFCKENEIRCFLLPEKPELGDYLSYLGLWKKWDYSFLMGWMRILPSEVCSELEILNCHPGLITKYPLLKGKDPQRRALELGLSFTGVVIHRVSPEVDSGEILLEEEILIENTDTEETLSLKLASLARQCWIDLIASI